MSSLNSGYNRKIYIVVMHRNLYIEVLFEICYEFKRMVIRAVSEKTRVKNI